MNSIKVLTLNVHKGFSALQSKFILPELREALRKIDADLIFLQEVLGAHSGHENEVTSWPKVPQYEYLADSIWKDFAYGKNAVYSEGHHGNAILSKYPIKMFHQRDISNYALEQRGLLHCQIEMGPRSLHAICVHLGLFSRHRKEQVRQIVSYIRDSVPEEDALIVAGDFNDWLHSCDYLLVSDLEMKEAHQEVTGNYAKTFPAWFPILSLDRIYSRNGRPVKTERYFEEPWKKLSDHAALWAEIVLLEGKKTG